MSYPYGMQGMPKVGNGLGGLPRRPEDKEGLGNFNPQIIYFQAGTSPGQVFEILKSLYSYFRITVVGGGGGGGVSGPESIVKGGGGGGGLAVSPILPVQRNITVEYAVGFGGGGGLHTNITSGAKGGDSYAKFLGYELIGGGGFGGDRASNPNTGLGGIGSGGIENHNGGRSLDNGTRAGSGGGAAGVSHDGDNSGAYADSTGGGGGAIPNSSSAGPGGGGSGARGGSIILQPGSTSPVAVPLYTTPKNNRDFAALGFPGGDAYQTTSNFPGNGGIGGGGGGAAQLQGTFGGNGGVGIVRIELW